MLKLTQLESFRGDIAGWLLLGFGLAYMVWGLRHAVTALAPDARPRAA